MERWADLTAQAEVTVSSRLAMVPSLTDGSTETFWESGEEDRNKTKWISVKLPNPHNARSVAVHVDNGRDIGNKVGNILFKTGKSQEELVVVKSVEVETRFAGWLTCFLSQPSQEFVKIEVKGPDNTVRLRQVKVIGGGDEVVSPSPPEKAESHRIQQSNCETETLRVFRLITGQVFGKLLEPDTEPELPAEQQWEAGNHSGTDLKEHVVGILFSRSKLTHLQKQVCHHIVAAINKEAGCLREDWELSLCSEHGSQESEELPKLSDSYCFEMLSMVLALSGSKVSLASFISNLNNDNDVIDQNSYLYNAGGPAIHRPAVWLTEGLAIASTHRHSPCATRRHCCHQADPSARPSGQVRTHSLHQEPPA